MEKTIITLKNGKKMHITRYESYHFTYEHIIKKIIEKGAIKNG